MNIHENIVLYRSLYLRDCLPKKNNGIMCVRLWNFSLNSQSYMIFTIYFLVRVSDLGIVQDTWRTFKILFKVNAKAHKW